MQSVYIDNNVWDLLFEKNIDLLHEFPLERFRLSTVREHDFEFDGMPLALKEFVQTEIVRCGMTKLLPFGFYDDRFPASEQRVGGWGQGVWLGQEALKFRAAQQSRVGPGTKGSGLLKNETDVALAAESFTSIVLTRERASKRGPLKTAALDGGAVISLQEFDPETTALGPWVADALLRLKPAA